MKNPLIIVGNSVYTKSKNVKYQRNCDNCKQLYFGWGKFFCSKKCRIMPKLDKSPFWKGENITFQSGRQRAEKIFTLKPCESCGSIKSERHHIDNNPINNAPENIKFLCRKHHIEIENRLEHLHSKNRLKSSNGRYLPNSF